MKGAASNFRITYYFGLGGKERNSSLVPTWVFLVILEYNKQ